MAKTKYLNQNSTTQEHDKGQDPSLAIANQNWHNLSADVVLKRLDAKLDGLTPDEVEKRLLQFGPNQLLTQKKRGFLSRLLAQFKNILIYVLLMAAVITTFLGEWLDAGVILGVVVINAVIGLVQEGKAERALESLSDMMTLKARVQRNGEVTEIPSVEVVPGDILLLRSGDKVPADARLLECKSLKVEESLLTGESEAVEKAMEPVAENAVIGDRLSLIFSSTLITYGSAKAVVFATGQETEIGKISSMLKDVEELKTPLLRQIDEFGRVLTVAILGLSLLVFAVGFFFRDYEIGALFLSAVAVAVAAIPEGLPAIMTITLALGVQRMAARNTIIRRLPAVETLGSIAVIFTDKTGTLTRNEMTVKNIFTAKHCFEVTGSGYKPRGEIQLDGQTISLANYPQLRELIEVGVGCNDSSIKQSDHGGWLLQGEPTEGSLVTLGMKIDLAYHQIRKKFPRLDTIPFESERRYMASLHRNLEDDSAVIFVKGGPEKVLSLCRKQQEGEVEAEIDQTFWEKKAEKAASEGHRLLGLAMKKLTEVPSYLSEDDMQTGLVFLGFVGIVDPPRDEAVKAIADCMKAGITVKMVTGDHQLTAKAIGIKLGIAHAGSRVIEGHEIEATSDQQLDHLVNEVNIYARVSPEHKLRLVKAMQNNNKVIAMTGDGVNDAPALKRADVGIAMGNKGTEVSKNSAEMILLDDNFASIVHAVEEGRGVYDNLRKSIIFLLPTNGGQASIIFFAIIFGLTMPLTPVQALWINMVSAVTLALSLAFEPPEKGVMERPPREANRPILDWYSVWRVAFVSILLLISALGLFHWELTRQGEELAVARTAAVNMVFFGQAFYLFNTRFIQSSSFHIKVLYGNPYIWLTIAALIVIQLLYTYTPFMQELFGSGPLSLQTWLIILGVGFTIFILVEIEKKVVRISNKLQ